MRPRVYLAGPDVFLPDPHRRGAALRAICAGQGLEGVFPLDPLPDEPADWAALPLARAIARRNEAHIRRCHAVIANLTPFRGPGADGGTAYEVGFARALCLPVFGWSNVAAQYAARCQALPGTQPCDGTLRDAEDMEVEAFGLGDNLMISWGVAEAGAMVSVAAQRRWEDLDAFAGCVAAAVRILRGR